MPAHHLPPPGAAAAATTADASAADLLHSAFYRFVPLAHPEAVAQLLRDLLAQPPFDTLQGTLLLAAEGINGMLAGPPGAVHAMEETLRGHPALDNAFAGLVFKHSACRTRPFGKMKVHVKPEIVPLGIDGVDARRTGIDVSPRDWDALIREPDVVLLDNRNSFEYRLGHFEGAIDPQVTNFRDFPAYVREHAAQWKAQGKRIAMYCTGGIRCEKTSAWMRDLELPVYQLEGGILNYFQQMQGEAGDWRGECFVFDNRVALDTRLQETATTLDDVYVAEPDGAWRLARARRLAEAAGPGTGEAA